VRFDIISVLPDEKRNLIIEHIKMLLKHLMPIKNNYTFYIKMKTILSPEQLPE
jgi:hypothetical protein